MNLWVRIVLTDLVVTIFGAFMQFVYKNTEYPALHTLFVYICSIAILVLPVFLITMIWAL